MPYPISVKKNDYHKNPKCSTVYTPVTVSKFLFDILRPVIMRPRVQLHDCSIQVNGTRLASCNAELSNTTVVFDPAIGTGRLTDPWHENCAAVYGCDTDDQGAKCHQFDSCRFEDYQWWKIQYGTGEVVDMRPPDLVLCNPPFNGAEGRQLYPEVFLRRIFDLFGATVPTVLVCPMGLRLNQKKSSKRWRWLRDCGAKITSIVSLPTNTFPGVDFHTEILIFNVDGILPHYWLPEEAL